MFPNHSLLSQALETQEAWDTKAKAFYFKGKRHRDLYMVSNPILFDMLQSWGEQVHDKKGNNILDVEINLELARGA